jgi:hypothetical protein
MKNERFANNIKHKNKIKTGNISRDHALVNEKKTSDIIKNEKVVNEVPVITEKSLAEPAGASVSGPDIASVNNDVLYSNFKITIDDDFFKTSYRHYNNPFQSFRNLFSKAKNVSEAGSSDHKKAGDSPAFGIISLAAGVVGLFVPVVLGIILGIVALAFGILGVNRKLNGLAIAGIVLGVLIIILGLLIIAMA